MSSRRSHSGIDFSILLSAKKLFPQNVKQFNRKVANAGLQDAYFSIPSTLHSSSQNVINQIK